MPAKATGRPGPSEHTDMRRRKPIQAVAVDPIDPNTAYTASNAGVYKTTDLGITWTTGMSDFSNLLYQDVTIDPDDPQQIFAAAFAGVYASTDGGLTWGNMSAGIPAGMEVTSLSFNATSRHLAASTYGRGAFVINLPPVVSITSPANGTTVSGTVGVSATASRNVVGVQFKLDGVDLQDTAPPFQISWNTTSVPDGSHTLTAVARDAANLTTTSSDVTVIVNNVPLTATVSLPITTVSTSVTTFLEPVLASTRCFGQGDWIRG